MMVQSVRVRFAPSPTGYLHLGNVRVALMNYLFARHSGGVYLIRIEDTDVKRSTKGYEASQLDTLAWLNLLSDEPIVHQSENSEKYYRVVQILLKSGKAYPCFCQPREEGALEADSSCGYKYDGTCRDREWREEDLRKPHAIRFKIPSSLKQVDFDDLIRGQIVVKHDQLDDFVIMRRDRSPTYNFSVVVDDIDMKITHVIRGEDHISNTPKQLLIYRALDSSFVPKFAHLPMILGSSGNVLSKRDAAIAAREYRHQGFLADALCNYLIRLGWSHGDQEIFDRNELIKLFSFEHVGKKGGVFDMQKLQWLNGIYIREASNKKLVHVLDQMQEGAGKLLEKIWGEKLSLLIEQYKQRVVTLRELYELLVQLATAPRQLDVSLLKKWYQAQTPDLVSDFLEAMQKITDPLTARVLLEVAQELAAHHGVKLVSLAQPLRLALTGTVTSPGVFELISILGREESVARIRVLYEQLLLEQSGKRV